MFAAVRLSVTPDDVQARPGDRVSLTLTVKNASTSVERYRIALSGIPTAWFEIEPDILSLFPDASAPVRLTLAPPAGSAAAGTYPLTITATSERDPSLQTSILVTLTVARQGGLRLSISPAAASGKDATYHITVRNDANAPAALALLPRDLEGGLLFHLSTDGPITVPPGEERTVALRVVPALAATVGQPMLYELEVRGVPEGSAPDAPADPALLGQAAFTYLPRVRTGSLPAAVRRLPLWALLLLPLALLGAVFLAGARSAGALTGGNAPPSPTATHVPSATPIASATVRPRPTPTRPSIAAPRILRFDVSPAPRGALVVHWATAGASAVRLNGKPAPSTGSVTLAAPSGAAPASAETLILAASGAGGTTTRTLVVVPGAGAVPGAPAGVAAYLPVVETFTADLGPGGVAVLRWKVIGADTVRVDGKLVAATGQEPLTPGGGVHTFAAPHGVSHTLVATNRYGSVTSTLTIPVGSSIAPRQMQLILHPPSIDRFTLDRAGSGYQLTWQVTGATAVLLNGKRVGPGGTLPIPSPQQGMVFDLVASNADGASHAQQRVALSGGSVPPFTAPAPLLLPRITTFALAQAGGQLMVNWRVVGADRVALDGKTVPSSGSLAVPPGATTLTLVAGNAVGVRQRQLSVPGPSPTALPSETSTPVPATVPPATGTTAPTGTAAPKATGTRAAPTHTATPRPGAPTHTATPRPNATHTATPPPGSTSTATALATGTPVPTSTRPSSPTATVPRQQQGLAVPTFTHTPTPRPSSTATVPRPLVWTRTPTVGPVRGPSSTPSATAIPGASATATMAPSATGTPKPGITPSATGTATTPPTHTATSTATASPSVTVTPTATATATLPPSSVTVSPTAVHFPAGNPGSPAAFALQPVTVTNPGPSTVTIASVSISGTDAAAFGQNGCQGSTLNPNSSCTINVSFNAATSDQGDIQGNYTASLVVTHNGSNSPQTVALSAGPRTISASPSQITLALSVPTQQPEVASPGPARPAQAVVPPLVATVTVTNNGPGPLSNVNASFQGNGGGFSAQVSPACQNLAQGANCTVTVSYTLGQGSGTTATLVLTPQGGSGTVTIPVTVQLPSWSLTTPQGTTSVGSQDRVILIIKDNGPGQLFNIDYSISDTSNFTLLGAETEQAGPCPGGTVGFTLNQGESCAFAVQFVPKTKGASFPATVTATAFGNPPSNSVQLTGIEPTYSVQPQGGTTITSFTQVLKFTVTNTGSVGELENISASLSSNPANAFQRTGSATDTCGTSITSLGPGGTCQVEVQLNKNFDFCSATGSLTVDALSPSDPIVVQLSASNLCS